MFATPAVQEMKQVRRTLRRACAVALILVLALLPQHAARIAASFSTLDLSVAAQRAAADAILPRAAHELGVRNLDERRPAAAGDGAAGDGAPGIGCAVQASFPDEVADAPFAPDIVAALGVERRANRQRAPPA